MQARLYGCAGSISSADASLGLALALAALASCALLDPRRIEVTCRKVSVVVKDQDRYLAVCNLRVCACRYL